MKIYILSRSKVKKILNVKNEETGDEEYYNLEILHCYKNELDANFMKLEYKKHPERYGSKNIQYEYHIEEMELE